MSPLPRRRRALSVLSLTVALLTAACNSTAVGSPSPAGTEGTATSSPQTGAPASPAAGGTLRIATPYPVTTLDPIKSVAAGDIEILGQLYSRLLRRSPDGSELLPALAERWEESQDKLTWTFELRKANFSDGSPITAEDVVFSYTRLRDQEESAYGNAFQVIDTVEAVDERTVRFTLTGPAAPFLGSTEMFNAGIVPKAAVEKMGDEEFGKNPVVSGPFKVREWRPNDRLILERNEHYWREGLPRLDVVEFIEVSTQATRVSMLLSGEAEVVREVPWAQISELQQREGIVVPLSASSVINIVLLNHNDELIADQRVRRAMAMAIDREGIAAAVTFGHGTMANSPLPNTLDYYDQGLPAIPYDPDGARALLEEAGATGKTVKFMTTGTTEDQTTQLIQAQLNEVGLNVTIEQVDSGSWWDRLTKGDYQATVSWWYNETPDPAEAVRWALCGSCGNSSFYTFYENAEIDQLADEALTETDPQRRGELYARIQALALEEVSQIPLYYQPYANAQLATVQGLVMNPAIQWSLDETSLSQ